MELHTTEQHDATDATKPTTLELLTEIVCADDDFSLLRETLCFYFEER